MGVEMGDEVYLGIYILDGVLGVVRLLWLGFEGFEVVYTG